MKHKKLIVVINEFPEILSSLRKELMEEDVDFILDSSSYAKPVLLLRITTPDHVLFNLKLDYKHAIEIAARAMQDNMALQQCMITSNLRAYYMSLCSTFYPDYIFEENTDLAFMPGIVAKQQLN